MQNASSRRWPDLLTVAALAALVACFWAPWIARRDVPVPGDQQRWMLPWSASMPLPEKTTQWDALWWDGVAQFYPWRIQLHRWLRQGEWPLWNENQFCGYPFVGNGQSAMFYPPNWLLIAVHPRVGLALLAALHFALALLLTYAYCRAIRLPIPAAAYAGIAFAFGGFMVGWTPLPTLMNCAAWLPGCLLGIELIARRRGILGAAVLGVCAGMTILAGHLQIAAYVLLATALYALGRIAYAQGRRRPIAIRWIILGALLAAALGSAQLLPAIELGLNSPRGGGESSVEAFESFHVPRALKPVELMTLVMPDALGSLAGGDYRAGYHAPGAAYGERCGYVGLVTLALAVLGIALGTRRWRWGLAAAAIIVLWAAMGGLPARIIYFGVPKVGLTGGFARLLCLYTFCVAMLGGLGLEAVLRLGSNASGRARGIAPALAGLAVVALITQLLPWAWRTIPAAPADSLYADTAATDHLRSRRRAGDRMLAVTPRADWDVALARRPSALFPPNSATVYDGLESVQGYDSLYPRWFKEFGDLLEGECAPRANGNMMLLENADSPLMDLAGVRWVLTRAIAARDGDAPGGVQLDGVRIDRRPRAFPRAFLTSSPIAGGSEALVGIATAGDAPPEGLSASSASCNRLTIDVPPRSAPVHLVVTNTAYPGWRAWREGAQSAVIPVGGTFQGLRLLAGEACPVLLAFVPASVNVGLFLFLLAAGTIAALPAFRLMGAFLQRPEAAADGCPV